MKRYTLRKRKGKTTLEGSSEWPPLVYRSTGEKREGLRSRKDRGGIRRVSRAALIFHRRLWRKKYVRSERDRWRPPWGALRGRKSAEMVSDHNGRKSRRWVKGSVSVDENEFCKESSFACARGSWVGSFRARAGRFVMWEGQGSPFLDTAK